MISNTTFILSTALILISLSITYSSGWILSTVSSEYIIWALSITKPSAGVIFILDPSSDKIPSFRILRLYLNLSPTFTLSFDKSLFTLIFKYVLYWFATLISSFE